MPVIVTADRAVASVTATESEDWQVVSTPTGFRGITSADFSDNDKVAGFVIFENGEDYEVYDTDDDTTSTLLEITNISGTVTISRPATPYKSSNGGDRVSAGAGTHTLVIGMGAGTAARLLRETNPTWKTFSSGDATPDVSKYRLFKTNGTTTITAFDSMEAGKVFYVKRGNADITIADGANIELGGANITLTATTPSACFMEDAGVAVLISVGSALAPGFLDGGTVAAASNVITVEHGRRYRLTASDSIQGVDGLTDGQFCQVIAPSSGTTTLVDGASPGSGQALELSGANLTVQSTDETIYTLERVGSAIRVSGGGGALKADLTSTASAKGANLVGYEDAGGLTPSGDVDAALDEIFAAGAATIVANKAALTALATGARADGSMAYVRGTRGGLFRWDSSDLSTEVGLETSTYEGVYWAPDSDGTGASGAWVREAFLNGASLQVEWFGAAGDGSTDDATEFQAAIDFADALKANGFATASGIEIRLRAAIYYIASNIQIPTSLDGLGIIGPGGKGAFLKTDQAITLLRLGDDMTDTGIFPGGDTSTSDPIYNTMLRNITFVNATPTSAAVALEMNRCPSTRVENCQFIDFYRSVVGHRLNFTWFMNCKFLMSSRTSSNPADSAIYMEGVYDSTNVSAQGGNVYFINCEINGKDADTGALPIGFNIRAVDGLFVMGGHCQSTVSGLKVNPDASTKNNRVTDIRFADYYFDNMGAGPTVNLTGSVTLTNGLYQRINFTKTLFRGANAGTAALIVDVTSAGGFDNLRDISINSGSEITQYTQTAVVVNGAGESRLEPRNITVEGTIFELNNASGGLSNSCFNIEAKAAVIRGNTFRADANAATRLGAIDVSGAAGETSYVGGNAYQNINCTNTAQPLWVNAPQSANVTINEPDFAGLGRIEHYSATGVTTSDEALILGYYDMTTNKSGGQMYAKVTGISTDTTGYYAFMEVRGAADRNNSGTITQRASQAIRTTENIASNSLPAAIVLLNGTAWSSGAASTVGLVYTNGGNAYLILEAGSGTTGTTFPTFGGAGQATDSNSVRYLDLGAVDDNRLALVVSATASAPMTWIADIDLVAVP